MAVASEKISDVNGDTYRLGHDRTQWKVAIIANLAALTYGIQCGWISPMIKLLQSESSPVGPISNNVISWIASTFTITAVVSVPLYSYAVDKYGRKATILVITVAQTLCWIIKLVSTNFASLVIARVFCGIGAGGCFIVIPMYIKEISRDEIRGTLGCLLVLNQNLGILTIYAIGAYLNYYSVIWFVIWIPVLTFTLMFFAPESPDFLVKCGKEDEAASALAFLRGLNVDDKVLQKELDIIKNQNLLYNSLPPVSLKNIFNNRAWRRGFFLILTLTSIQSSNGNFAIVTYASSILSTSGVTFSPELQTLSFPIVMTLGSFVSLSCMQILGRKTLFTLSLSVTVISFISLGTLLLIQNYGSSVPSNLPVFFIMASLFSYAWGTLPIPYIMMAETFNFQIRAKVMGCIVTHAWFMSSMQLSFFTPISNALGMYATFYIYAGINLFGIVATLVFIPETKGKTVEEIEEELRK